MSDEQVEAIVKIKDQGTMISKIVRATGVSRSSVYRILEYNQEGLLAVD